MTSVGFESTLQPITDERLHKTEVGACVDIKAEGFSENNRHCAFLDVRVLIPSYTSIVLSLSTCYRRHKQERRELMMTVLAKWSIVSHFLSSLHPVAWTYCQSCVQNLASMSTTEHTSQSRLHISSHGCWWSRK